MDSKFEGNIFSNNDNNNQEQNNAIGTNYIKAKIDNTEVNSKYRLCGERDETINHIIRECSKMAKTEYKTRHDCIGKVILWELFKRLKFDYTNK